MLHNLSRTIQSVASQFKAYLCGDSPTAAVPRASWPPRTDSAGGKAVTAPLCQDYYPGAPYEHAGTLPASLREKLLGQGGMSHLVRFEFDCLFVVDDSPNMLSNDVFPSRWEATKDIIRKYLLRMVHKQVAARAGIMYTSSPGVLICPPTPVRNVDLAEQSMSRPLPMAGELWYYMGATMHLKHRENHVIVLSDGRTPESRRSWFLESRRRFPSVHSHDCIGVAGSASQVDEEVLMAMASSGRDGRPRYRWIGQAEELINTFADLDLEEDP